MRILSLHKYAKFCWFSSINDKIINNLFRWGVLAKFSTTPSRKTKDGTQKTFWPKMMTRTTSIIMQNLVEIERRTSAWEHEVWCFSFFMVARSSVARELGYHYILRLFLFIYFFSRHTFSDVGKPTSSKLSHTTWLSIQQNLCYTDFIKVPPKTTGGRKTQNLHRFSSQVADN